jgi:hypothetical protein
MIGRIRKSKRGGSLALALLATAVVVSVGYGTWVYHEYTGNGEDVQLNFSVTVNGSHYIQVIAATSGEIESAIYCGGTFKAGVGAADGACDRDRGSLSSQECNPYTVWSDYTTTSGVHKLWVCDVSLLTKLLNCPPPNSPER